MGSDKGGSIGSYEVKELGCSSGMRILCAVVLDAADCKRASELDNQVQGGIFSPRRAMRGEDCLIVS
jgi:hypothetical protein